MAYTNTAPIPLQYTSQNNSVDRNEIEFALAKVEDPEIGVPIMEMNLIEKVDVREDGHVYVEYHYTTPYCPPMFGMKMAQDIKANLLATKGVTSVALNGKGHYMAEFINKAVNTPKEEQPSK